MFKHRLLAIGADPEIFFTNKEGPKSVEGLLGGSKHDPKPMVGLPRGFFIQEDNVCGEFNIPPATNATEFNHNILTALKYVQKEARRNNCKVLFQDTAFFKDEELATPHAQLLGCEPDYNVWTERENPRPKAPEGFRTAAAHLHFSWSDPSTKSGIAVGKMADLYTVIPSLLVTKPSPRRSLYGKAGAWRFKDYGGEHRTLSNFWLISKPYRYTIWNNIVAGFRRLNAEQDFFIESLDEWGDDIQTAINEHDVDLAIHLIDRFQIPTFPVRI